MPVILFPCECGMTLKASDDGRPGGTIECPACGASVLVPSFGKKAEAAAPDEHEAEADPTPAGHENLAIIAITLSFLLTIGAVGYFLVPALRGPKANDPGRVLAAVGPEDPAKDRENSSGHDRKPGPIKADPVEPDDDPPARLPRYTDPAPDPAPVAASPAPPPATRRPGRPRPRPPRPPRSGSRRTARRWRRRPAMPPRRPARPPRS